MKTTAVSILQAQKISTEGNRIQACLPQLEDPFKCN